MTPHPSGMAAWALAAGIGIPLGATLGAALGRTLGHPIAGAFMLAAVAALVLLPVAWATGALPGIGRAFLNPPPFAIGGCFFGFYLLSVTVLIPRFGTGNTILFVLAGQVLSAAAIDQFGLFGAMQRPMSSQRLAGLALFVAALVIIQTAPRSTS